MRSVYHPYTILKRFAGIDRLPLNLSLAKVTVEAFRLLEDFLTSTLNALAEVCVAGMDRLPLLLKLASVKIP